MPAEFNPLVFAAEEPARLGLGLWHGVSPPRKGLAGAGEQQGTPPTVPLALGLSVHACPCAPGGAEQLLRVPPAQGRLPCSGAALEVTAPCAPWQPQRSLTFSPCSPWGPLGPGGQLVGHWWGRRSMG